MTEFRQFYNNKKNAIIKIFEGINEKESKHKKRISQTNLVREKSE